MLHHRAHMRIKCYVTCEVAYSKDEQKDFGGVNKN